MLVRRSVACLLTWGAMALLANAAWAAAGGDRVYREDFGPGSVARVAGGVKESRPGGGSWRARQPVGEHLSNREPASGVPEYVEYDVAALEAFRPSEGSVGFWLENVTPDGENPGQGMMFNSLFEFLDRRNETVLTTYMVWLPDHPDLRGADSFLSVWVPEGYGPGRANFGEDASVGRKIKLGEKVHVAFSWNRTECEVFADGRSVLHLRWPAGDRFEDVRKIRLGLTAQGHYPSGRRPMYQAAMSGFSVATGRLYPNFQIESVVAGAAVYGAGQEVVVTLRGSIDGTAAFTLAGVAASVPMEEVDDGVYVGSVVVPADLNFPAAALTGTLTDPATGQTATLAGRPAAIDSIPPEAPSRVLATAPWAGEIELTWSASPSVDLDHYLVFRGESRAPDLTGAPLEELRELTLVDTRVIPGLTYHYAVVAVDKAGNRSSPSEEVSIAAVAGDGPAISSIRLEPFGRPLRPGQSVTLAVTGQSGGSLTVDLGELGTGLALTEQGRSGTYLGTYTVGQADVGPTRGLHRVVAHLADDYGSSSLAGPELAVVGLDVLNDVTPPVLSKASHDGFAVAGFSGKLVAGDVVTVTLEGEPECYASFEIPGVAGFIPMSESQARSGTYIGTYTVGWSDEGRDLPLLVTLTDEAGNETNATAGRPVSFDTRVRLLVSARDSLLPADKKATTRLVAKATNANGDDVSGHELALTLSTTEEYTGVVGGGRLEDRQATKDDVDNVEVRWGGVTDSFGEVAATYTAGFAAKTALILAKNLTTGDVGAGWLHTYVASTVALEILPRAARGTPDRAILRMSADPEWLTADGRSTSRLKAVLTDLAGNPLVGQRVTFALGSDNGRLRVLRSGLTDEQGLAEAEYRAGTLAGFVTITAASREHGVTAAVQLELRADAPAKIDLVASAQKLIAGDKATLSVTVTDIHDNPNIGVPVTFALLQGNGSLAAPSLSTDRNGQGAVAFTAGSTPGTAVIEARHTSRAPNEEELRRVYGTVFVPRLAPRQERDRVRIVEWLVKPREEVAKGQPLVTLEGGNGTWTLASPDKGVFVRQVMHRRDRVELGDTLGYVEIDAKVWQDEYGK